MTRGMHEISYGLLAALSGRETCDNQKTTRVAVLSRPMECLRAYVATLENRLSVDVFWIFHTVAAMP